MIQNYTYTAAGAWNNLSVDIVFVSKKIIIIIIIIIYSKKFSCVVY